MAATWTSPYHVHTPMHFRGKLFFLALVVVLGAVFGGVYLLKYWHRLPKPVEATMDSAGWPSWMGQKPAYPPIEPAPVVASPPARDINAERYAQLQKEMAELRAMMQAQKQQPAKTAAPPAKVEKPKYAPMLFVEPKHAAVPAKEGTPAKDTYVLAPGATKIPCQIETAMNSDVPGYFTAKTRIAVYDTATGQHLLIPQNSTILGKDNSDQLLYGNERLNTLSLTLALPDGSSYDIGEAPVTDQQGVAGLTGRVNSHFWRLAGAVLVTGALRGGAQMVPQVMAGAGPVGAVGSGIAQAGGQTGQKTVGRTMDTRPTIEVDAGQLCTVILLKPLTLPEAR